MYRELVDAIVDKTPTEAKLQLEHTIEQLLKQKIETLKEQVGNDLFERELKVGQPGITSVRINRGKLINRKRRAGIFGHGFKIQNGEIEPHHKVIQKRKKVNLLGHGKLSRMLRHKSLKVR